MNAQVSTYHYVESGLDNVYLCNGFDLSEDGDLFIHDINGLHKAIGISLAQQNALLSGKEIKFIRRHLDISQKEMGNLLDVDYQTILNWEKGKTEINGTADSLLKIYYNAFLMPETNSRVVDFLKRLSERIQATEKPNIYLQEKNDQWALAA